MSCLSIITHALEHPKHNLSQTSPMSFFFHSLLFISYPPNLHVASLLTVNLTRDGGFVHWDSRECSLHVCECACVAGRFSVWLCDHMDCGPPGSSIPGILQARILERVATSFSNACTHVKSLQSCSTLCDPMDSSPLGSSVHKIL